MSEEAKSNMVPVTGLWQHTTQKGDTFLSGNLGNASVFVFKNSFKKEPNQPDYQLCLAARNRSKNDGADALEEVGEFEPQALPVDRNGDMPFQS